MSGPVTCGYGLVDEGAVGGAAVGLLLDGFHLSQELAEGFPQLEDLLGRFGGGE